MSWKNLKIFAIVTLLLMDIVLAFFVVERKLSVLYYEDTLIDSALTVFSESGLQVDRSFLKKRKTQPAVYLGATTASAQKNMLRVMQQNGFSLEHDESGIRFQRGSETFFFGDDFVFSYVSDPDVKAPSLLLQEGLWSASAEEAELADAAKAVTAFFNENGLISEALTKYHYEISCDYLYRLGDKTVISCKQSLDGTPLYQGFFIYVSEGTIQSAQGIYAPLLPKEKKNAENIGLMNVLFAEKAYIDQLTEKQTFILSSVRYSYGCYFDADGTFYLIPLCEISYANGETRTYNFVSGTLYS